MMGKWLGTTRFYFAPPGEGSGAADSGDDNGGGDDNNDTNDDDSGDDDAGDDASANLDGGEGDDDNKKPAANASPQEKQDWRDRQIDRQHRRIKDMERENATLRAIAEGRANPDGTPKTPAAAAPAPSSKPALTEADVETRAQQLAAQNQYDADCNAAYAKGKDAFEDWEDQLKRLPKLGGIDPATMVNILATDNPEQVIYTLASNPEEYERVMELPMAKRANALTKLGMKKPKEIKRPSDAPNPPDKVTGRRVPAGKVDLSDDNVPDEDWYAERERQRAARKRA